jgi:alpha-glucoside transport system permease protein
MSTVALPTTDTQASIVAAPAVAVGEKAARGLRTLPGKILVWALAAVWTIPTFGLLVTSFRPEADIKSTGWWKVWSDPRFTLDNYRLVFESRASGGQFSTYFLNSVKITIPGVVIPVLIAAFAAYAFSWMEFKGRNWLFVGVVALMVVPLQMALIPLLRLFTGGAHIGDITLIPRLGFLSNSVASVWLAHTIFALPLAVFLLNNFISQLPKELMEAAKVDGAGHLTIFFRLVVPLSVPALASLAIFQFLWVWNDLLVALVFAGGQKEVAPMTAKLVELSGSKGESWHLLTAGAFVTMVVPIIVFFSLQRFFVRGLVAGSVKG